MNLQLLIDGIDFTENVENPQDFKLNVGLDESTSTVTFQASDTLILNGAAAKYVEERLLSGCGGLDDKLSAQAIVTDFANCPPITLDLWITARSSKCCPNSCKVEASLVTIDQGLECKEDWDNTLYWEKGFIDAYTHVRMPYRLQPNNNAAFTRLLIRQILLLQILLIYIPLLPFILVIASLCNAVNTLPGININCPSISSVADGTILAPLFRPLDERILGTGSYNVTPRLRDIFEYHAARCGMQFKSSVLSGTRENSVLWCMDVGGGLPCDYIDENGIVTLEDGTKLNPNWQDGNQPIMTLCELAEMYACATRSEFRIIGDCIYIEEESHFRQFSGQLYDLTQDDKHNSEICYQLIDEELCRSKEYAFCKDPNEKQGTKNISRHSEFKNLGEGPSYKKKCKKDIPFAPAKFGYDWASYKKFGNGDLDAVLDNFADGAFGILGNQGKVSTCDIVISSEQQEKCKIIALDENNEVIKKEIGQRPLGFTLPRWIWAGFGAAGLPGLFSSGELTLNFFTKTFYHKNWPYYLDCEFSEENQGCNDLWADFFSKDLNIEDRDIWETTGAVYIPPTHERVKSLLDKNIYQEITTHKGQGSSEKYCIDFGQCLIIAEDVTIRC